MAAVRILLVEDEEFVRTVFREYLESEGCEVVEARDGGEAIRILNAADGFDVLFTDVRMPGAIDGIDVAEHARRRHPEIPLLVMSGYAMNLIARFEALDPPTLFLSKPCNLDDVRQALGHLIEL